MAELRHIQNPKHTLYLWSVTLFIKRTNNTNCDTPSTKRLPVLDKYLDHTSKYKSNLSYITLAVW